MEDNILLIALLIISVGIYFLPSLIAYDRKHASFGAVFVANLLLGWTGLGWIFSLIWAFIKTNNTHSVTVEGNTSKTSDKNDDKKETSLDKLERLAQLKKDGVLDEDEFKKEKAIILGKD